MRKKNPMEKSLFSPEFKKRKRNGDMKTQTRGKIGKK